MSRTSLNTSLRKAKKAKQDEFYTRREDIENELKHYKDHFKNKVVYCNCDDPRVSEFFRYFARKFRRLGLKKLITTCYKSNQAELFTQNDSEQSVYIEYKRNENGRLIPYPEYMRSIAGTYKGGENDVVEPNDIGVGRLKDSNGDFRSHACVELLKQADVVVTNPPFSLFREYVAQLVEHDKKFVIIGSMNAVTYKEIFKLIKENKLWMGYGFNNGNAYFKTPHPENFAKGVYDEKTDLVKFRNVTWFTNLGIKKRHEKLIVYKKYTPQKYPKYDNYDAIEVSKTKEIPEDYAGYMGVPISFLDKYNPDQFEIIGLANDKRELDDAFIQGKEVYLDAQHKRFVGMVLREGDGLRATYARIIIKNKKVKRWR